MGRNARVTLLLIVLSVVLVVPVARAQEYGESFGDLTVPSGVLAPGDPCPLSGDGFLAGSAVSITLMANVGGVAAELGVFDAGSSGAIDVAPTIPLGLADGAYTVSATGVTEDGATRILSGDIEVQSPEDVPEATTTTALTETTAGAETTVAPTTTLAGDTSPPEALPFEGGDADGGSNTGLIIGGIVLLLLLGGVALWRYQAAVR